MISPSLRTLESTLTPDSCRSRSWAQCLRLLLCAFASFPIRLIRERRVLPLIAHMTCDADVTVSKQEQRNLESAEQARTRGNQYGNSS
jgi:hypothetical protein